LTSRLFLDAPLLVYLNTLADDARSVYEDYYIGLLTSNIPYTDALVLDEVIYVSHKKYKVPYRLSIEFIESIILPYVSILNIGEREYMLAVKYILEYMLKPSDAIHLAVMKNNNIDIIVSEDKDYDKIQDTKRIWLKQKPYQ